LSAQDHISELQFEAHRGIRLYSGESLTKSSLGMHWSTNKDKAEELATTHMHWPDKSGVVLHGAIPISSVETDTARLTKRGYMGFPGKEYDRLNEKEVPVKESAPVKVTGITKFRRLKDGQMKERKRSYNPPRAMKA